MTAANSRQTLLAINSAEWLNLCARGSIRMSKRRPIVVSNPASEREMERVFTAAPFTKLDSSVDLFILALDDDWAKTKRGHRSYPSEILQLNLSDPSTQAIVFFRLTLTQNTQRERRVYVQLP